MRFKIPSKVRLLTSNVDVVSDENVNADGEYGHWDEDRDRIVLSPVCTPSQQRVTFLHEYLHATNRLLDEDSNLKHAQITLLAELLADLIDQLEEDKV